MNKHVLIHAAARATHTHVRVSTWPVFAVLFALLFALSAPPAAPVASAELASPLLQFSAGGHVVGFAPTQVVLVAFDHALRIEFVGTAGVTPVASNADAPSSGNGLRKGRAQPLGVVMYPDVWRGVSVEYRASAGSIVKSTYTVAPGADAAQIRLRYNVPVELQSDGSLQFSFGRGVMTESAPLAWQEIDGARVPIAVAFELVSDTGADASLVTRHSALVTFHVGAYDARYPLTIDPNYVWHTFYGSSSPDDGYGIALDGSGNVYITGMSNAAWQGEGALPNPLHAHSGSTDIVVVKLTSAGAYQWHTFYGSSSDDRGNAIAVDGSGNVYITGMSNAAWQGEGALPNPLHAHSGSTDIVVVKLTSAGAYQWHTFYGSSSNDRGNAIAVDGSGNIYITGESNAAWEAPLHPYNGLTDIVALKLDSAGAYQWHTFYGTYSIDYGHGIAVDGTGSNVYITGSSENTWGVGSALPLHPHGGPRETDIVVLKLTSAGAYQWHTFYGSASSDEGHDSVVEGSDNVYITGESEATWQGDGGANPLHAYNGFTDIIALKLTSAGAYQWHTFYGSDSFDFGAGIAVDESSNVYIAGASYAAWQGEGAFPNPLHAYSGGWDIVALKLTSAGAYQWHTFYGSASSDRDHDIVVEASNNVYITGESEAVWQGDGGANPLHAHSGGNDIVALKLSAPTQSYLLYLPLILRGN